MILKPKGYSENGESMQFLKFINSCLSGCNNISWNYYKNPWFVKDILDPVSAKKFIQQIFKNGEKFLPLLIDPSALKFFTDAASLSSSQEIFLHSNPNDQYSLPDFRATHTISGFFLGFLIEHCLTGNNTLSVTHPDTFPFSYFWFLTFLYHDFGYCVSEKEDAPLSLPTNVPGTNHSLTIGIEEYRVLRQVKNKLNICLSPFSSIGKTHSCHSAHSPVNEKRTLLQELTQKSYRIKGSATLRFNTGTQIHGCQYTSTVVTRYFNYCAKCLETLDHGIIGGYLFYDRMIKNYVRAYFSARQTAGRQTSLSDFTHKGRHFSEKQLILFSYIADCIMAHNIWKLPENKRTEYEKYNLDIALGQKFKTITFKDNPLLFILAVADTLEPTKIYGKVTNISAKDVCEALNIECLPNSHQIVFSSKNKNVDIKYLYSKATSLESWTAVRCSELKDGRFTLALQPND